jgi:hypothetical protein
MNIVKVPRQAFLGLVRGFLSGRYRLYLTVKPMAVAKEIGCSTPRCTEILKIAPPDDAHTTVSLTPPKTGDYVGDIIEREYECGRGHITKVYWYSEPIVYSADSPYPPN